MGTLKRSTRSKSILPLLLLTLLVSFRPTISLGQSDAPIFVQIDPVPVDIIRLSDFDPLRPELSPTLFTLVIVNDDQRRNLQVGVAVSGQQAGFLGTISHTIGVVSPNESILLTNRDFDDFDLSDEAEVLAEYVLARGQVPVDEYSFAVTVTDRSDSGPINVGEDDGTISTTTDGTQIDAVSPGQPLGSSPETVTIPKPVFYWQSSGSTFDVELFEVLPGQLSQQDISTNFPLFRQRVTDQTTLPYPAFARELEAGKLYAWQVSAISATVSGERRFSSEMFWFTVEGDDEFGDDLQPEFVITPPDAVILPGETLQYSVQTDLNALNAPSAIQWSVVPSTAGSISAQGLFTAAKSGIALIKAASTGSISQTVVTVKDGTDEQDALEIVTPSTGEITTSRPAFGWSPSDSSFTNFVLTLAKEDASGSMWSEQIRGTSWTAYPANRPVLEAGESYRATITASNASGEKVSATVQFEVDRDPKFSYELSDAIDEAKEAGAASSEATILVKITGELTPNLVSRIENAGATIEIVERPWVQLSIPFNRIAEISQLSAVQMAKLPAPHQLFSAEDDARNEPDDRYSKLPRIKGDEVHVAVLEFGFDEAQVRSILGDRVQFHSFRSDKKVRGSSASDALHGVLSVKALSDFLPENAVVHLINFDTEPEFQAALRYAVEKLEVRVVTCSVSWSNAYDHYDGTSDFSRSITSTLKGDVAMIVAAGNFGQSHWEDTFRDQRGNGVHSFGDNEYLELKLSSKKTYNFLLSWDDWSGPDVDLDLEMFTEAGQPLLRSNGKPVASRNKQSRTGYSEPVERISGFRPFLPGIRTYRLSISKADARSQTGTTDFELYIYPPPEGALPLPVSNSSLASGVATADSRTVIPVGAIGFQHSSTGPTNDGRRRPDFVADGRVVWNDRQFEGTSFATPRVAGLLASVLSKHPSWSFRQGLEYISRFDQSAGAEKSVDLVGAITSLSQ